MGRFDGARWYHGLSRQSPRRHVPMVIDGVARDSMSGATMDCVDPFTEQAMATVPRGSSEDVDVAVAAALRAFDLWAAVPHAERAEKLLRLGDLVDQHAEDLARLDSMNGGNPIRWTRRDSSLAASVLRYFAGLIPGLADEPLPQIPNGHLAHQPFGVVGLICAYNHPLAQAVNKTAAALAAGNTVVLKPADQTPLSALAFAEIANEILPPGVLNVVTGLGAEAGNAIVEHPEVRRVSFTGSVEVGEAIQHKSIAGHKTVTMELGGKNPFIVLPDADIAAAVRSAVVSINFAGFSGQSCTSTSRLYLHEGVAEEFTATFLAAIDDLSLGDPLAEGTDMGPLAFESHWKKVRAYIELAEGGAGRVLGGGTARPETLETGYFVRPTVIDDVSDDSPLVTEEIFGPVVTILTWSDCREVVRRANDSPFGLAAGIWTSDADAGRRLAAQLEVGTVMINGARLSPGIPFGGWKASGIGKELCFEDLLSYTREKVVLAVA